MTSPFDFPFAVFDPSNNCTTFGLWRDEALAKKETTVTIANFLRTAISPEPSSDFSNGELVVWWEHFMQSMSDEQNDKLIRQTTLICIKEVCDTMSWEGNSDISGVG